MYFYLKSIKNKNKHFFFSKRIHKITLNFMMHLYAIVCLFLFLSQSLNFGNRKNIFSCCSIKTSQKHSWPEKLSWKCNLTFVLTLYLGFMRTIVFRGKMASKTNITGIWHEFLIIFKIQDEIQQNEKLFSKLWYNKITRIIFLTLILNNKNFKVA